MLHECKSSVIRTETSSFRILKSLSFKGHIEKKWSIFLMIKCKQRFFVSISTICFPAGAEELNDVGETDLKRGPQPYMGPYRYMQPPTTYLKLNCTVQARTQ